MKTSRFLYLFKDWGGGVRRNEFVFVLPLPLPSSLFSVFPYGTTLQQHGFSDSTPRAGNDRLQKSAKNLLSALQLMSISQISTQKYGWVIPNQFKSR